jgi:hypothetical protein
MTLKERIEKLELELKHTKRQRRLAWCVAAVFGFLAGILVYPPRKYHSPKQYPF